jgi:hydrogenase maturation protease
VGGVVVVGCGNPDAADDAIGVLAIREARVALEAIPGTWVVEGAIGPDLTDLLAQAEAAVIVDAIRTPGGERPPGTIVRVEASSEGLPAEVGNPLSSHGFGVGEAVALAVALGRTAPVVFFGVEAGDVTVGRPLTPAVREAVPDLVRAVVGEAGRLASRT